MLGDKLIVELAVKLGDLLQIPREDARLVVVERVDVDARVRLVRHDVVELAAVDTLGALDGLTQRMAAALIVADHAARHAQLLGTNDAVLLGDDRVRGVMFTGSTEVATLLQRNIASRLDAQGRPIPLIAETGGMNAMIVDSSALTEQVVVDVLASAFDSAGQRCSALRVLCLQDEIADHTLKMLRGAMAECRMGNPGRLTTDIGPVIIAKRKPILSAIFRPCVARPSGVPGGAGKQRRCP